MEKNKVLILGAGLVVKPMIEYLKRLNYKLTIASKNSQAVSDLLSDYPKGRVIEWGAEDELTLNILVKEHDIVASFLPYTYHLLVAKYCIANKKDMITASYVKPEMAALDKQAKEAGIIILNELGLDPGIDHMSAMKIIDDAHSKGYMVEEFYSFCGALPTKESIDNPLNYKFSWSPKGVIMAANNDAVYLKDGEILNVPTDNLFKNPLKVNMPDVGIMEVYPNRDSISYIDVYKIPEVKTIMRGTFRFENWCEIMDGFKQLKMTSYDKFDMGGKSFVDMLYQINKINNTGNIKKDIISHLKISENNKLIETLDWLGLLSGKEMNRLNDSMFEITSDYMIDKMMLSPKDSDLVVMQHTFVINKGNMQKEVIKSSMIDTGNVITNTAIARTVSLPAAIGIDKILKGEIKQTGVYQPVIPEIYEPIMADLLKLGIKMKEEFGLSIENKF